MSEKGIVQDSSDKQQQQSDSSPSDNDQEGSGQLLDLFKNPILFLLTMIQVFSWFVNSLCYYGLTIAAGQTRSPTGQETQGSLNRNDKLLYRFQTKLKSFSLLAQVQRGINDISRPR